MPPFSPRDEKGEKGFKDALILETLLAFDKSHPKSLIVFVCADGLLSKTASAHLSGQRFLSVSSLEEFVSHVNLRITQASEKFTAALLAKAKQVFYTENDSNCIWFKFNTREKIHDSLAALRSGFFGDVYEPRQNFVQLTALGVTPTPLAAVTEEFVFLDETGFLALDEERFYHWQTKVELRQIFKPKQNTWFVAGVTAGVGGWDERLRRLVVGVKWKAKISDSPPWDFTEENIEAIDLVEEKFGAPSWDDYVQLRHPLTIAGQNLQEIFATTNPPPTPT